MKISKPKPTGRTIMGFKEYKACPIGKKKCINVIKVSTNPVMFMTVPQYKKHLKE